ncbi:unnamed protein product [Chondrus crispus]|uniref:Uncharacterized protein n=1 Tax=Chondrus crispus TaxID=2769 RepID=R7QPX0_CHOCR|nr:unnamed protein product [Chondrus crispus]CDF40527.1 unnamed protein product [Chondrus crispus]|eukprot:XP_005710821.1 unnamed protein product [Chondrus crispus]
MLLRVPGLPLVLFVSPRFVSHSLFLFASPFLTLPFLTSTPAPLSPPFFHPLPRLFYFPPPSTQPTTPPPPPPYLLLPEIITSVSWFRRYIPPDLPTYPPTLNNARDNSSPPSPTTLPLPHFAFTKPAIFLLPLLTPSYLYFSKIFYLTPALSLPFLYKPPSPPSVPTSSVEHPSSRSPLPRTFAGQSGTSTPRSHISAHPLLLHTVIFSGWQPSPRPPLPQRRLPSM